MPELPIIPEYITVHLGRPDDASARNITIPFVEYIKNVASSEIYPTWPESAIRANVYAQITYALNRIYTEYYRSRGYDFDITNSTQYDQYFVEGRDIFQNISEIVDDIFNDYVVRQGQVQPYFTQYCNGTTVTCDGLSQWGTVDLARDGMTPYEILQHYYGDDIDIVFNAPIAANIPSYPGIPLRRGMIEEPIRTIQRQLNRIGQNYPSIPRISELDGIFDLETEEAVKQFQRIFNLTPDGIVGKATWYKIKGIYNGVTGLNELYSEGLALEDVDRIFQTVLKEGDTGPQIRLLQYFLAVIGYFDSDIPIVAVDGIFGPETRDVIMTFQNKYGIPVDGIVGRRTWDTIRNTYQNTINALPPEFQPVRNQIYPGYFLALGEQSSYVTTMQQYLRAIAENDPAIPTVEVTGTYDQATENAVRRLQEQNGLPANGVIGPLTWELIVNRFRALS
ncbi:peptidoglycan-binding protein [Fumia xinanensis]|uniref:Peptidoglycan-binding protein n=1 Tax=Fumia xinanensis TaxID=2763659 RepID=A0A926I701_9FIRM|nr:peptidoglycan-binding protein [Fumia xinanensis]MBC8559499.1 peptidoglycan-binding protein [Fumia xinanensis]